MRYGIRKNEAKQLKALQIKRHMENLNALGYKYNTLKPLRTLENKAHKMAENECNGTAEYTDEEWDNIEKQVKELFNKPLYGLILNSDPRGYCLKIDSDILRSNKIELYQDWGGYGILSPDFN